MDACAKRAARCGAAVTGLSLLLACLTAAGSCAAGRGGGDGERRTDRPDDVQRRLRMVETQIVSRGVHDPCVLAAMRTVPRHLFVPEEQRAFAYSDGPLPIGEHQTISQPYIVALMTELIRPEHSMKVLEIGTGSGYQAAVLAECVGEVYTIEILPDLARSAAARLRKLGYHNVHGKVGDGYEGWPEEAPFDAILVTAAPPEIPRPLLDQLAAGGRLVIPVGRFSQDLIRVTRTRDGFRKETITAVRFVPMTGKAGGGD